MDCAICLTAPDKPQVVPCCQQTFCAPCLNSWVSVRNCCPLCIAPLGPQHHNQLTHQIPQQFDNGGLILQSQLDSIVAKLDFLRMLLQSKQESSNNYKSHFPKAHLNFVTEEISQAEDNLEIAQLSVATNDRVTATATIQNIAEALIDVEAILLGESTLDFGCDSDSEEDEQEDYDYGIEDELYLKNDRARYKGVAAKANSKKKIKAEE